MILSLGLPESSFLFRKDRIYNVITLVVCPSVRPSENKFYSFKRISLSFFQCITFCLFHFFSLTDAHLYVFKVTLVLIK